MLKKYLVFALLFCVLILPDLFGAAVSCLVIETGAASGTSRSQYSAMWENSLMDVLFESGHIVSNGRMIRLDRKPNENFPAEAERAFQEARENGMDYFIIAIIEQNSGTRTVSLRLFSVNSQNLIKEQVYADNNSRNTREENESIKRTIGLIAAQIK